MDDRVRTSYRKDISWLWIWASLEVWPGHSPSGAIVLLFFCIVMHWNAHIHQGRYYAVSPKSKRYRFKSFSYTRSVWLKCTYNNHEKKKNYEKKRGRLLSILFLEFAFKHSPLKIPLNLLKCNNTNVTTHYHWTVTLNSTTWTAM